RCAHRGSRRDRRLDQGRQRDALRRPALRRAPAMSATVRRLLAAKALRAFADGYVALLLPAYLLERGFTPLEVGIIATTTLAGSGLATLGVGWIAHRYAHRALLLAACALMAATGVGFVLASDF